MFDEITNEYRAEKARNILNHNYMAETEGLQTALTDLLADVLHLASATADPRMFDAALRMARDHHETEQAEEAKEN